MTEREPSGKEMTVQDRRSGLAVGLIVTDGESDAVAGAILRARERGRDVLVTYRGDPNREALRFASSLGATVVDPTGSDSTTEALTRDLAARARAIGYEGLVVHESVNGRVDWKRTMDARDESSYVTVAIGEDQGRDGSVLVGIPAYNEASAIEDVVTATRNYVDAVVVVDDGSDDETADIARRAGATVISHDGNKGYGATLKTLFREATARNVDHLVVLDGDGQHDPADIPTLVACQRETDSEIVIASRFTPGAETDAPFHRRVGLAVINLLVNFSLGIVRSRIRDTQSGFRAYDHRAIELLSDAEYIDDRMGASIDILYLANRHDFSIREISTTISYDVSNASTHDPLSHGTVIARNIFRTIETKYPMVAFGLPGLVLILLGTGFGYWTIINYLQTDTFPIGLAITTALFTLTGIFSTFTAIILHALNIHRRVDL